MHKADEKNNQTIMLIKAPFGLLIFFCFMHFYCESELFFYESLYNLSKILAFQRRSKRYTNRIGE
jgi:hypothetical protein